jgi:hypothetical protein
MPLRDVIASTRVLLSIAAAALVLPAASTAQTPTARIRGVIESAGPAQMVVRTREGDVLPIALKGTVTVSRRVKATTAAIGPKAFVGVAAEPGPDRTLRAVEVFVFPEAMRGTGEGHRPFDLTPESTMTNATLTDTVETTDGKAMKLAYKGGEQTILLTPETAVFTYAAGSADDLKPGRRIAATVEQTPDGGAQTSRVSVDTP